MYYCKKCGAALTPEKRFCSQCGTPVEEILIPQNSKRMHDSEKGANPTVTASKCKA